MPSLVEISESEGFLVCGEDESGEYILCFKRQEAHLASIVYVVCRWKPASLSMSPAFSGSALTETYVINFGTGSMAAKAPIPTGRTRCITGVFDKAGVKTVIVAGGKTLAG